MTAQVNINSNEGRLLQILLSPHVSEKGTIIAEKHRQFIFKVLRNASKPEIKLAVEKLFEVKVESVRVCNVKAKIRRFKQTVGQRKSWKKAYVALAEGYDIDFIDINKRG